MPPETLAYAPAAPTRSAASGCFQHAIPVLEAGGGGSLTACVSMANHRTLETDGLSAIPKAAVESMVRQIAAEEAANGIRANAVPIGWVGGFANSFAEARAYTAAMSGPEAPATRALMERIMSWIRMGRPGTRRGGREHRGLPRLRAGLLRHRLPDPGRRRRDPVSAAGSRCTGSSSIPTITTFTGTRIRTTAPRASTTRCTTTSRAVSGC